MNDRYRVFLDFDGTITENDVGYEMFKHFTREATEPLVQAYRRGEVNSRDCLAGECDIWNACAPETADVWAYLDSQPIRMGFDDFLAFLVERNLEPVILSEGFDFYIDRILSSHSHAKIRRITNVAGFRDNMVRPEFPFYRNGCDTCSSCKGQHIRNERPPKSSAIYIGDGHSDLHASGSADIIFARSHLAEIMEEEARHFHPYDDFHDILDRTGAILDRGIYAQSRNLDFCFPSGRHARAIESLWENGEVMKYVGYPGGLGKTRAFYDVLPEKLEADNSTVYLAIEDHSGAYVGEAKIAFPDSDGFYDHDLKLLPAFQGRGLGFEAWGLVLARARARWPKAAARVTPNIENERAIALYQKLGFQFHGAIQVWTPPESQTSAVPVRYRNMIKP